MKVFLALLAVILVYADAVHGRRKWALLVAGSRGYDNYRHQADVAHSFQLLVKNGIPKENIVVMMYDDVAYNRRNPFQGNLINVPNGPNVYAGINIDYKGADVNKDNFLSVLQGDHSAMRGKGSGKVILSNSEDNVFVYYADHGNKGFVAFPTGGMLYTRELLGAIDNMHKQGKYHKMVFYVEACFSGSMFVRRLPSNINVYAVTAANDRESSWSCYYDRRRRTSLADDFSIKWMLDSEAHDMNSRTLNQQYAAVKRNVRLSHVCLFGDARGMGDIPIGVFQGSTPGGYSNFTSPVVPVTDLMPSWDVPYMSLFYQLQDATTTEERLKLLHQMVVEEETKLKIHESIKSIAGQLVTEPEIMMRPKSSQPTEVQDHCYEQAVVKFGESCYQFEQYDYAMKDLHVFANLCNTGESIENIYEAIESVCSVAVVSN